MRNLSHLLGFDPRTAGNGEYEATPRGAARHGYRATMQFRDALHQVKSEPSARLVLHATAAKVFLKESWHLVRRDAASRVRDRKVNAAVRPSRANPFSP